VFALHIEERHTLPEVPASLVSVTEEVVPGHIARMKLRGPREDPRHPQRREFIGAPVAIGAGHDSTTHPS
jgi:hypothetical protein